MNIYFITKVCQNKGLRKKDGIQKKDSINKNIEIDPNKEEEMTI